MLQIRNSVNQSDNEFVISGKVKTIFFQNDEGSADALWVGINEDATNKFSLGPGAFQGLSKDDGSYYAGNTLKFRFENSNAVNKGVIILETEWDDGIGGKPGEFEEC